MFNKSTLYKIFENFELPSYIKTAGDYDHLKELYSSNKGIPADPVEKKYLCYDEATTILSACMYFLDRDQYTKERREVIENNFKKIASGLGILEDYLEIEKQANNKKQEVFYAARIVNSDGQVIDAFPIRNKKEASIAIDYIWDNWRDISPGIRKEAASNILNYCEEKKYILDKNAKARAEVLARQGAFDFRGFAYLCDLIKVACQSLLKHKPSFEEYINFCKVASDYSSILPEDVDKAINICQEIGQYIPRSQMENPPEEYIYVAQSRLEECDECVIKLANGYFVDDYSLLSVNRSMLRKYFSDDELKECIKDAHFLYLDDKRKFVNSLDREQADRFIKMLSDHGFHFYILGTDNKEKRIPE